jgi:hypothetical protein
LLAQLHAPDLAYHFHGDHFLALLLKYSAEQLNTLVNFESALLGLDGQFSVGGNTPPRCHSCAHAVGFPIHLFPGFLSGQFRSALQHG